MRELGDVDESRQVLEVRALVVELAEIKVLSIVALSQRLQRFDGLGPCEVKKSASGLRSAKKTHFGASHASCS